MGNNKHKTTLLIMAIAVITLSVIAGTYAYFTAGGTAQGSNDITVATVGSLTMTLSDDAQTGVSGAIDPQNLKFTTYLKVENGGLGDQYARLMFKNLVNTYSDYLVYSLDEVQAIPTSGEATVAKNYKNKAVVPKASVSTNTELSNGVLIHAGTSNASGTITPKDQYFRVTIEYLYSDTIDQSDDLNKQFVTEFTMELGSKPARIVCVDDTNNNAEIPCGTITTGTKIEIGETNLQRFYVISNNNGTIRALAEYNLYVGNIYSVSGGSRTKIGEIQSTDAGYGLQNENAKGYVSGADRIGTVAFYSGSTTSPVAYTQYNKFGITSEIAANTGYSNYAYSDVKTYVDAYLTTLNGSSYANGAVTNADLISFPELTELGGCTENFNSNSIKCNNSTYPWLNTISYWSSSASNIGNSNVWCATIYNNYNVLYSIPYINDYNCGVRPVITISESSL